MGRGVKRGKLIRGEAHEVRLDVVGGEGDEAFDVEADFLKAIRLFICIFIHIEGFVHLDLQAVEVAGGVRPTVNEFDAFEGVVNGDAVAEAFDEIAKCMSELQIAAGAVAVA